MKSDIKNYLESNSWKHVFFKLSSYFFVATLPWLLKFNTIGLWFLVLSTILVFKKHNGLQNLKRNKQFLVPILVLFLLYVLGFFLSKDTGRVQKDLGRVIPLVLIPIAVFSHRSIDFNLKKIYTALGVGLFTAMLICWYNIFISIISREDYLKQAGYFFNWIYTDWNLVKPLDGHPSYFAILIVIFISGLLFDNVFASFRKNRLKFVFLFGLFMVFLIETNSRIGVITFFVILLNHVLRNLSVKLFISFVILFFVVSLMSVKFDYLGSKFRKIISPEGHLTIERLDRWDEIVEVFNKKDKFLFGVGSGDARLIYRRAYYNGGFDLALKNNYNAHNQFLEFYVSNGLFGLFIYMLVFFVFFKKTRIRNNSVHFLIVFLLFSMSESFLGRSQGVMMFSFFYSFLILYYNQNPTPKYV